MKAGIFVGFQIKQLFEDQDFCRKRTWKALKNVCRDFLLNEKLQ